MWNCHGEIVARTPAVDVQEFFDWSHSADPNASIEIQISQLADGLVQRFRQGPLKEALAVASPSLCKRIATLAEGEGKNDPEDVMFQLARYWTRTCFRATPFGLFSGVGLSEPADLARRFHVARLDCGAAAKIAEKLLADPALCKLLSYKANETLELRGEVISYIERQLKDDKDLFKRVEIDANEHLLALMQHAQGLRPFSELVDHLLEIDPEYERESVEEYLLALLQEGVLIPSLALSAHAVAPEQALLDALEAARSFPAHAALQTLVDLIDAANQGRGLSPAELIENVQELLKSGFAMEVEGCPLQFDSYKTPPPAEIKAGTSKFSTQVEQLSRATTRTANGLDQCFGAMRDKFGNGEVPLLTALDEINGVQLQEVFYQTPLLEGLNLRNQGGQADQIDIGKLLKGEKKAKRVDARPEIEIDDKALSDLDKKADRYSEFFVFMVTTWQRQTAGESSAEPLYVIEGFSPGLAMLGRFCHLDSGLHARVRELAHSHMEPEVIRAEICFNPGGRVGNVSLRPELYTHHIPLFCPVEESVGESLALSDLVVKIIDNRRVLYSRRLKKEVRPMLPNAHNFMGSKLPLYKFLSMAQNQGRGMFMQDAFNTQNDAAFLPQIRYKNIVLRRRRWSFTSAEFDPQKAKTVAKKVALASEIRDTLGLPRFVSIMWGDQQLMLDLQNPVYLALLTEELGKKKQLQVEDGGVLDGEHWLAPDNAASCVERLVAFTFDPQQVKKAEKASSALNADASTFNVRQVLPGGEWLYVKLYAKPHVLDEIITHPQHLSSFLKRHAAGLPWHMVRFRDSDWHLRLRFRLESVQQRAQLEAGLYAWCAELQARNLIQRTQIDSYEQETERYGGPAAIAWFEQYFHLDSECVLSLLSRFPQNERARWLIAVASAHGALQDFGFSSGQIFDVVDKMRENFGREFNDTPELRKLLGKQYTKTREELATLLREQKMPKDLAGLDIGAPLMRRRERAQPLVTALRALESEGQLFAPLTDLVQSIVHMAMNRIFLVNPREHEFVVYDLLRRHLLAESAKAKGKSGEAKSAESAEEKQESQTEAIDAAV